MDFSSNFYLAPREFDAQQLTRGVQTIQLVRASSETFSIDPNQVALDLQQEHPPVERMEGDLGAICEVYKQSSTYFLSLTGTAYPLLPGDRLTLTYHHQLYIVTLTVIALENGRVRIDPPVIRPQGKNKEQQG